MRSELKNTFISFVIMMFSLAVSVLMSVWMLMKFKIAIAGSGIIFIGVLLWWKYAIRMYNKFYLDPVLTNDLQFEVDGESEDGIGPSRRTNSTSKQPEFRKSAQRRTSHTTDSKRVPSTDVTIAKVTSQLRQDSNSEFSKLERRFSRVSSVGSTAHGDSNKKLTLKGNYASAGDVDDEDRDYNDDESGIGTDNGTHSSRNRRRERNSNTSRCKFQAMNT